MEYKSHHGKLRIQERRLGLKKKEEERKKTFKHGESKVRYTFQEVTAVVWVKSDGGLAQGGSHEGRKKWSDPKYILNILKVETKS